MSSILLSSWSRARYSASVHNLDWSSSALLTLRVSHGVMRQWSHAYLSQVNPGCLAPHGCDQAGGGDRDRERDTRDQGLAELRDRVLDIASALEAVQAQPHRPKVGPVRLRDEVPLDSRGRVEVRLFVPVVGA